MTGRHSRRAKAVATTRGKREVELYALPPPDHPHNLIYREKRKFRAPAHYSPLSRVRCARFRRGVKGWRTPRCFTFGLAWFHRSPKAQRSYSFPSRRGMNRSTCPARMSAPGDLSSIPFRCAKRASPVQPLIGLPVNCCYAIWHFTF